MARWHPSPICCLTLAPILLAPILLVSSAAAQSQARLIELGVQLELGSVLEAIGERAVELSCAYTGRRRSLDVGSVVMVTARDAADALHHELRDRIDITRIGDCLAPATIAAAVYSGHRYAREMDDPGSRDPGSRDVGFRREHAPG